MQLESKQHGTLSVEDWKEFKKYQLNQEVKTQRPIYGGGVYGGASQVKTAGEIFINSDAYKKFIGNGQKTSDAVSIPALTKALVTSRDTGGDLMGASMYLPNVIGQAGQAPTLRSLLAVTGTQNNAVEYLQEVGFTNASAPVAEGALKPESAITFEEKTALVKTIAHWLPATKQSVSDVAGLQAHIDMRLMSGLATTEESQILYGSGTGENIEGIMINPNVQVYTPVAEDTRIDTLRRAMTRVFIAGYAPTGIVMNPNDFEDIELQKDTAGNYIYATVTNGGEPRMFRVPVVQTTAINQNEFLVGAFGTGAQLFDRERASIQISDSHADFFIRNQLAILAEERIALAIYRPESFVRGTFTAGV